MHKIFLSEREGKAGIFFETGLDPRSFARTKLSQCFTEPGYIVQPDGTISEWKAAGVFEKDGFMSVWGSPFNGKRLDVLIDEAVGKPSLDSSSNEKLQEAFAAVSFWIKAKLLLGDRQSALNPGASFVSSSDGTVFFAPENLSHRCLLAEGTGNDRFVCPDLSGIDAAGFCAGVMLYKILSKVYPYSDKTIYQDMREGVFLPPHLVSPGLDKKLCGLIQSALSLPVENKKTVENGTEILSGLLKELMFKDNKIVAVSSLFTPVSAEERGWLEKEKNRHLKISNISVNIKRFVARNKVALYCAAAALVFIGFVTITIYKTRSGQPTTTGMNPTEVIVTYYEAFSSLDHVLMEACINHADKSDVDVAVNLSVINKVRRVNEGSQANGIIPAELWKKNGGEFPAPNVFGVTDLEIELKSGSETSGHAQYRANYTLWYPNELPANYRSDDLTLRLDKKRNWRITEILRSVNYSPEGSLDPTVD